MHSQSAATIVTINSLNPFESRAIHELLFEEDLHTVTVMNTIHSIRFIESKWIKMNSPKTISSIYRTFFRLGRLGRMPDVCSNWSLCRLVALPICWSANWSNWPALSKPLCQFEHTEALLEALKPKTRANPFGQQLLQPNSNTLLNTWKPFCCFGICCEPLRSSGRTSNWNRFATRWCGRL